MHACSSHGDRTLEPGCPNCGGLRKGRDIVDESTKSLVVPLEAAYLHVVSSEVIQIQSSPNFAASFGRGELSQIFSQALHDIAELLQLFPG